MATYHNISRAEMTQFLESQGFTPLALPGVIELVWRKRFEQDGMHLSLWVFTGIEPNGNSREVGKDAIRLQVMYWDGEKAVRIGGSRRVHRVKGWRANLQDRINNWLEMLGPKCPKCGKPTVLKEPKSGQKWQPFFGCVDWKPKNEGCNGSAPATQDAPKPKAAPQPKRTPSNPLGLSRSALAAEREVMMLEMMHS